MFGPWGFKVSYMRNALALMTGIVTGVMLTDAGLKPDLSIPVYVPPSDKDQK
ncbi:hypothetical protein QVD99_000485 [Batrachochytrium dendrobatidis]|nr:hypothetical protein O5D80_008063 [Batrachochytrium dendrobatidis]KAK5673010.1 hypothetical protein QVD99_000485 [Batrachochytrium dendrobatidis]